MKTETRPTFSKGFDNYACADESISVEIAGITYTATIEHDCDTHINDDDTHNIDQAVTGCNEEQQAKLLEARNAWVNNKWFYCGIVLSASISASKGGVDLDISAALWGIECNYPGSDNSYLLEVANELLEDAIKQAVENLTCVVESLTGVDPNLISKAPAMLNMLKLFCRTLSNDPNDYPDMQLFRITEDLVNKARTLIIQ